MILREFLVNREVPYFRDYLRTFTDAPFLVALREHEHGLVPDGFLTAADLGHDTEHAGSKIVLPDAATGQPVVPNGSLGFRWGKAGQGRWNLDLGDVVPELNLLESTRDTAAVALPRFDKGGTEGGSVMVRGAPVRRVGGRLVTTVFDLMPAGQWPALGGGSVRGTRGLVLLHGQDRYAARPPRYLGPVVPRNGLPAQLVPSRRGQWSRYPGRPTGRGADLSGVVHRADRTADAWLRRCPVHDRRHAARRTPHGRGRPGVRAPGPFHHVRPAEAPAPRPGQTRTGMRYSVTSLTRIRDLCVPDSRRHSGDI